MKTVFLFPGQGAQAVGMGKDLAQTYPQADMLFNRASEIAGFDLKKLCFEGPKEELDRTDICQPAIFTVSAAFLEVLRSEVFGEDAAPAAAAGLSLGEYTALYAAGVISFEDGLRLVHQRGRAMQEAAQQRGGAMVSIIGLDEQKVQEICTEASQGAVLKGVNFNCPSQIVVSGDEKACQRAAELAEKAGAVKAVKLAVAGAFHTQMMSSAAEKLAEALEKCPVKDFDKTKVIANTTAQYYTDAEDVRKGLVKQLVEPILWQKCMERLLEQGYDDFYEIGPGRVLTGLMKRINRKIKVKNISTAEAVKGLVKA